MEQLTEARALAEQAVAEDVKGSLKTAVILYMRAANLLEAAISGFTTTERQQQLNAAIEKYRNRAQILTSRKGDENGENQYDNANELGRRIKSSVQKPHVAEKSDEPPNDFVHAVCWVARVLHISMKENVWLTPKIHLTPAIWSETDTRIPMIQEKTRSCVAVFDALNSMQNLDRQQLLFVLKEAMDETADKLIKQRQNVAQKIGIITQSNQSEQNSSSQGAHWYQKLGIGAGTLAQQGNAAPAGSNLAEYKAALFALLPLCATLGDYYDAFVPLGPEATVLVKLISHIIELVNDTILDFVVRDVGMLVEMKAAKQLTQMLSLIDGSGQAQT